ncbi:hypothetical protein JNW88_00185 [Micromonospora sp. ATA32]|nr:hypothetical protein [Micromonospora sp. ATA32]
MSAPSATAANPATDYSCGICGATIGKPGFCAMCQQELDDKAAAESAAQTRALAGDPIATALRAHLATLSDADLRVAEHRAQIRIANAGRGLDRIKRLVDLGTLLQSSYLAAQDELEAARLFCGLVHETQQINLANREPAGE